MIETGTRNATAAPRKRAKPLLGTFVEITLSAMQEDEFLRLTDLAFAPIADVHFAMSFHEPRSDLMRLASAPAGEVCAVSAHTWEVLRTALDIEAASDGIFNVTVAPALVARGLLPSPGGTQSPLATSLAAGIELLDTNHVRIRQPVWIDLGGIAKGYAVDVAVEALQREGVAECVVNAGGDLRVTGDAPHQLAIRHPASPTQSIHVATLQNLAAATSGGYFQPPCANGNEKAPQHATIIGPARRDTAFASATVIAPSCAIADALTKVVWLIGADAKDLLAAYNASGALVYGDGSIRVV